MNRLSSSNLCVAIDFLKSVVFSKPFLFFFVIKISAEDKTLSTSVISQYANFSPDYLRKQFKFYMKQSLYDYILTVRIDRVKNYLWNTHYPINKIAKLCGFSSGNYLTLIFTKKEKISPSKYRKIKFPL